MVLTGAQVIMECLLEQGVDTVFGYPGGSVLNIYDALYEYRDRINHIRTAHEQGAAHAADGYARSSGKTGVCIATSGPGATNLVTGIATAYMDSVPVVAITGNVNLDLLGLDSFQEVDITGITMQTGGYHPGGVPHRQQRPEGTRPGGHSEGPHRAEGGVPSASAAGAGEAPPVPVRAAL